MHNPPYMDLALAEARDAFARDEVPVGAVIADSTSGKIISRAGNNTRLLNDPTAHAEMIAIKEACKIKGSERLDNCNIYVTLEPCPMCAQAISFARIRRLYFGTEDIKGGGIINGARIFNASSCHHKPEVYDGIKSQECSELLKQFFKQKR